jgi:Undecaprenyl-phosphate glucose phosphotransferase
VLKQLARAGFVGRTIVLFGAGVQGQRLLEIVRGLKDPWNQVEGVFDDRLSRTASDVAGIPVLGNLGDLVTWSRINQPDEILIALPWGAEERVAQVLQSLAVLPANVRLSPEFMRSELLGGRLSYQFGVPMLSAYEKPLSGWGGIWKRSTDWVLAALFLILAAPVMLIIAICIRLESPGPVLFKQPRYGFNHELIDVYKFRTMYASASDRLANRLTERDDPRVTRVGAFLRRTSLDELPQLFNVLRGEMSVVGPRPHAVRTAAGGKQCDEVVAQYAVRHKVKPGITGWAQVNGWRGTMETEEALVKRLEHDLYYIKHWSPWFDVVIVLRTFWTVLQGKNSY